MEDQSTQTFIVSELFCNDHLACYLLDRSLKVVGHVLMVEKIPKSLQIKLNMLEFTENHAFHMISSNNAFFTDDCKFHIKKNVTATKS